MRARTALLVALGVLGATSARAAEFEVTAQDAVVHTAPFDVAPKVTSVHTGDRLNGATDAQDGWLRVALPDGRSGFLRITDAHLITPDALPPAPAAPASVPPASPPPIAAAPTVAVSAAPTPGPANGPVLVGVMFVLLPVGSLQGGVNGTTVTSDAQVTVGLAPFIDVPVSPWVEIGASPQFVFKVKSAGADSATEYDLRARLTLRDPVTPGTRLFLRFSPGYSIVSLASGALPDGAGTPGGAYMDFAAGSEVTIAPGVVLVIDLGYQFGFQSTTLADGTDVDAHTQFVHLGVGMALGL